MNKIDLRGSDIVSIVSTEGNLPSVPYTGIVAGIYVVSSGVWECDALVYIGGQWRILKFLDEAGIGWYEDNYKVRIKEVMIGYGKS